MSTFSLINQVVLFGVAVVLPLSVGGRLWWWEAAAAGVLLSYLAPTGSAAAGLAVVPFLAASSATVLAYRPEAGLRQSFRRGLGDVAGGLARVYAVVAAGALLHSRLALTPFDLYEPIVELTAVHYVFAGSAALTLATVTLNGSSGSWWRVASSAVVLTAAAPPVVATGFVTGSSAAQIGGAVLMTLGVWLTALGQLRIVAARLRGPIGGLGEKVGTGLLAVSGLAVWLPMVLAVTWAAGEHWRVPALSVDDMARTHGLANAFAFCFCGLLARRLAPLTSGQAVAGGVTGQVRRQRSRSSRCG